MTNLDKDWMTLPDGTRVPRPKTTVEIPEQVFEASPKAVDSSAVLNLKVEKLIPHASPELRAELIRVFEEHSATQVTQALQNYNEQLWAGLYYKPRSNRSSMNQTELLDNIEAKGWNEAVDMFKELQANTGKEQA